LKRGVTRATPDVGPSGAGETLDRAKRLERLLPILRCPETGQALAREGDGLRTVDGSKVWPIVEGRPVLRAGEEPPQVMDPAHVSHGLPQRAYQLIAQADGLVLHLSAGGTAEAWPHVVEAEFAVFRNTDVVADVHALPFAEASFAAVLSLNAFEHYRDPPRAAAEILRVLKPGGRVLAHAAFLQPLHEAPWHFYNATRFGLERWFEGFETLDLRVSDNFNPLNALGWMTAEAERVLAEGVSAEAAERFSAMTLGELAALWRASGAERRDHAVWRSFLEAPQSSLERIAAGFEFLGRKPAS
jgi:SAM-dependent methyltransferase